MSFMKKFAYGASAAALVAVAAPAAIHAQTTSAQLRGSVTDASGQPISNATVTIVHVPSGTADLAVTNETGQFFQSGLRVGGPYTVSVSAAGFEGEALTGLNLRPGSQSPLTVALDVAATEVIVVRGEAINTLDLNNGVGSNFSASDISNQPTITRSVLDTVARDPLATGGGSFLSVAGVNGRFNGLSIDGSLQQNDFGLGSDTFATSRSPINIDAVESVSLVASDYNVTASGFTGGLVNVTTKAGTNEIDGSAFYYYRDENYVGENAFDRNVQTAPFDEKEYGLFVSGPIIKDRLFFAVSYDEFKSSSSSNFAVSDERNGFQDGLFNALSDLVQTNTGYDVGSRPTVVGLPETSKRILGRIDWNINADHNAVFTYQKTEETETSVSSSGFNSSWYATPNEVLAYGAQLYSDWSNNFSTSVRFNYKEYTPGQNCNAGQGEPHLEFRLSRADVEGTALEGLITSGSDRTITGGCDRFRHANQYDDSRTQLFASGEYTWNDHLITFGGEYEKFEVFNMFVPSSNGRFIYNDVDDILNNSARIEYVNAPSNNAIDGAADWGYSKYTLFAQDTWQIRNDLELNFGVRYERYGQDDKPTLSQPVVDDYGTPNTNNLDGLDLIMPRIGFRYTPFDRTTVTGGFGLFAGGEPKVWISNAFQVPTVFASANDVTGHNLEVPQSLRDAVAGQTPRAIDRIASDFEIPSDWKASLRLDQEFDIDFAGFDLGDDYLFTAQYLYTKAKDAFMWENVAQTQLGDANPTGVAPDGRTIYADLEDLGISNMTELTNADGNESHVVSFSLAKDYDWGFGFQASYAYQDVDFVSEGGSSRGVSSWRGITAVDRNYPEVRTSLYEIEHSFKLSLSYSRDFITDLETRFDLFGTFTSGDPVTYVFDQLDGDNSLFGRAGNGERPYNANPLYIPNQGNDSRVVYHSDFDTDAFFEYINAAGVTQGQIHEVNSEKSAWNQRWDFRFQQELPGIWGAEQFVGDNRLKLVVDIENVLNFLNDDWGTQLNPGSRQQINIVGADMVSAADVLANGVDGATALEGDAARTTCLSAGDCQYRFREFNDVGVSSQNLNGSVWRARIGLRYEF